MNDNNDDNDNIRSPDPTKIDRLIDDDYYPNDVRNPILDDKTNYDLDSVLELSKKEFNNAQEQEEQKAIELIYSQMKEEEDKQRNNKFNNMKTQLNKLIQFDKTNLQYELILSIIEMYENSFINEYNTNQEEYANIFRTIKTIRVPIDEIDNLKKIILTE